MPRTLQSIHEEMGIVQDEVTTGVREKTGAQLNSSCSTSRTSASSSSSKNTRKKNKSTSDSSKWQRICTGTGILNKQMKKPSLVWASLKLVRDICEEMGLEIPVRDDTREQDAHIVLEIMKKIPQLADEAVDTTSNTSNCATSSTAASASATTSGSTPRSARSKSTPKTGHQKGNLLPKAVLQAPEVDEEYEFAKLFDDDDDSPRSTKSRGSSRGGTVNRVSFFNEPPSKAQDLLVVPAPSSSTRSSSSTSTRAHAGTLLKQTDVRLKSPKLSPVLSPHQHFTKHANDDATLNAPPRRELKTERLTPLERMKLLDLSCDILACVRHKGGFAKHVKDINLAPAIALILATRALFGAQFVSMHDIRTLVWESCGASSRTNSTTASKQ
ncbi:unnamed protein product, partial [Amoebophrya sp. A25]|eukprot:GSA25T00017380001.1